MAREAPYQPPPTAQDQDQSVVHHGDSMAYNLRHARAHADQALAHARALKDRLSASPRFDTHYKGLSDEGGPAEEASETPAEERVEQRALRRGGNPRRADRMARRSDRGRSR